MGIDEYISIEKVEFFPTNKIVTHWLQSDALQYSEIYIFDYEPLRFVSGVGLPLWVVPKVIGNKIYLSYNEIHPKFSICILNEDLTSDFCQLFTSNTNSPITVEDDWYGNIVGIVENGGKIHFIHSQF